MGRASSTWVKGSYHLATGAGSGLACALARLGQLPLLPDLDHRRVARELLDVFRDGPHPVAALDRQVLADLGTVAAVAGTIVSNLDASQREAHASEHLQGLLDR